MAIVGLVLIAAVAGYLYSHDPTRGISQTVGDCSLLGAVMFGAIMCARAAHRRTPKRRAWCFLTLAFVCWTFGAAVTLGYGLTRNHVYPYPSIADIGFLSYPIPALAGLLAFPRPPALLISRLRAALDAVVIAFGLLFLSVATVLDSVVHSLGSLELTELVMVAYPAVDVVICSIVLTLGMRQPSGQRLTWLLLTLGMFALAVTDAIYFELSARGGNAQTGGPVVVGWMVAALLVGLATLAPSESSDVPATRRSTKAAELIPYLPVLAAVLTVTVYGVHRHPFIVGIGALLLAAVTARQIMILFENVTLTDNLENKVAELDSLGLIVTSSRDAILGVSLAGKIISANLAAEQLYGYPADTLGQSPAFVSPARQQLLHELIGRARRGEDIPNYATQWAHPNGTTVEIELAVSPIMHGTSFQGISVSGQDVTERNLVAASLEKAREDALEASRLKSEFLATMSHEIRTPMNGVLGLTSLLLDTSLDSVQRQYAEGVRSAGDALMVLINDILDFSKLEAGRVELDPDEFGVRDLVDEVAALLAPPAFAKGLELLVACGPDVPDRLVGDENRIRQILLNLASNAVKFTATGEVTIQVTRLGIGDDTVSVAFSVRDTGIGIAEDGRDHLFTSFSQGDASTTRRYGGTGLGLAISSRLVEAMGGRIGFDSQLGQGSTFWFELPLGLGAERAGSGQPNISPLFGMRALVVDDSASNRQILTSQLTSWGLVAAGGADGPAALRELRAQLSIGPAYDFAVIDLGLPQMDGIELAQAIAADPGLRSTGLIMMTSTRHRKPRDLDQAEMADWLIKPIRSSQLLSRLLQLAAPQPTVIAAVSPVEKVAPQPGRLGHILVVEDNALNQLVAEGIITRLGYQVDMVANGAQALQALRNTSYAAVLMDCHMPVMDGFAATREIRRRHDVNSKIPIIAMTAGAMMSDREQCLAAGMDDFVAKPVDLQAISDVLRKWIRSDDLTVESVTGFHDSRA